MKRQALWWSACCWLASFGVSDAQTPPWHEASGVPFSPRLRSIVVTADDEPVWFEPGSTRRRGALSLDARLPIFGSQKLYGACLERWLLIGPNAWVCSDNVTLSPSTAFSAPLLEATRALPFDYYTVQADGSFGYASVENADQGLPVLQLEPGFIVALRTIRQQENGEAYGQTTRGHWVPLRDLRAVRISEFHGKTLDSAEQHVAWAVRDTQVLTPKGRATGEIFKRLSTFELMSTKVERGGYLALDAQRWVRSRDITWQTPSPLPPGVSATERWLDVDTGRQVLTAYEGSRAVFTTLVSTGRGRGQSTEATPLGLFRIWVKLLSTEMSNLELEGLDPTAVSAPGDGSRRYYAIEAVPWVQFFRQGYGLHAAFWHDAFGTRHSHGCVNLSPMDAKFLFSWTGPTLPAGFRAIHPTPYDPGTWVQVR